MHFMPKLLVTQGPSRGAVFTVADGATVGRAWNNTIQLMDEQTSRNHARFAQSPKGIEIEDLGSRNGILVNGRHVPRAALKPGDEIQIGDTLLVYEPDFDLKVDPAGDATVVMYPPDPRATSSVLRKTLDAAHPEALAEVFLPHRQAGQPALRLAGLSAYEAKTPGVCNAA